MTKEEKRERKMKREEHNTLSEDYKMTITIDILDE